MENNQLLGYLWGIIPTAVIIYHVIKGWMKEAKDSGSVDAEQNIQIANVRSEVAGLRTEFQGKVDQVHSELNNIRERVNGIDTSTAKELQKIDDKLEKKFDQLTTLILETLKGK